MKLTLLLLLIGVATSAFGRSGYWYVSNYEIFRTLSGGNEARVSVVMAEGSESEARFAPSRVCGSTIKGRTVCSSVQISEAMTKGDHRTFLVKLPNTSDPLTSAWFE